GPRGGAGGGRLRCTRAARRGRRGAPGTAGPAPFRASFTQRGALNPRAQRIPGEQMEPNKVNAGSGAQWLLDGIALVRRHPGPVLSLVVGALGVVLMGGVLLAIRQADQGQSPGVGTLFAAFGSGKVARLLVLVLIAVAFMLLIALLLVLMLGGEGITLMQRIIE